MNWEPCPCCKGKGHVFNSIAALHPFYLVLGVIESFGDGSGLTRLPCENCDGEGVIEYDDDDEG